MERKANGERFSLLRQVAIGSVESEDFRTMKRALFEASMESLALFAPLKPASSASNPIQILDFFSGAGGTSLGFAALNKVVPLFRFLAGCDIDQVSANTYATNFGTPVTCEDVLDISKSAESIQRFFEAKGYDASRPLILIGCAPCQGFSSHRKKDWGLGDDLRNNLAIAFSNIVAAAKPDVFVMENVPEFLSKRHWRYFESAREVFLESGYTVKQAIYNAAAFGVPQERFRSLVVGMKKEFLLPDEVYTPTEYRTVRQAIAALRPLEAGEADPEDKMHKAVAHKSSTIDVIRQVPHDGGSLPEGVGPECLARVNGFSDVYGRLSWDKPSITITHYARNPASGRYSHPEQNRGLTAREAARLQSFPDGFLFEGRSDDVYRQIGEAVPPLLSCGIAASVIVELLSVEPTLEQLVSGTQCVEAPVSNSYSSVIAGLKNARRRS